MSAVCFDSMRRSCGNLKAMRADFRCRPLAGPIKTVRCPIRERFPVSALGAL